MCVCACVCVYLCVTFSLRRVLKASMASFLLPNLMSLFSASATIGLCTWLSINQSINFSIKPHLSNQSTNQLLNQSPKIKVSETVKFLKGKPLGTQTSAPTGVVGMEAWWKGGERCRESQWRMGVDGWLLGWLAWPSQWRLKAWLYLKPHWIGC